MTLAATRDPEEFVSVLSSDRDVEQHRKHCRLQCDVTVDALQRDESANVLVARRWNVELAGESHQLPSHLGERRIASRQAFESLSDPRVQSGCGSRHSLRVTLLLGESVTKEHKNGLVTLCHLAHLRASAAARPNLPMLPIVSVSKRARRSP